MRDKLNLNLSSFETELEKRILGLVSSDLNDLRSDVIDISNFHRDKLRFFPLKNINLKDFIKLGILSWYVPEEIGFILREDLRDIKRFFSLEDQFLTEFFLNSKKEMILFLQETQLWHTRDFFGNILSQNNKLDKYFKKIKFFGTKIKKPQRKRGYDDHGSRVEEHRKLPKYDFTLTELQNQIEQERKSYQDMILLSQGFLY